jgi:acetylornithine deacetylase/succinyl-diaminopimelate desuccinylase-like protein
MYTPPDDEFVKTSLKIAKKTFKRDISLRVGLGACDGRYFTKLNIPTIKGGPCGIDEKGERMLHRKDEWVPIDEIEKWSQIYLDTAKKYLAAD